MTYLAVQMSLYLVSAALIGMGLGWCFWGQSKRRKIADLKSEMTATIEAERGVANEARRDLERADARLNEALAFERAGSAKAMGEVRQLFENEKKVSIAARAEIEQLRRDTDITISAERATAADTIREAMERASSLEEAVNQARARETQVRAELEELRLMAGAEKLAAQTARSTFDRKQREMELSLEAERSNSAQAQQALDDIRATLARTFGDDRGIAPASAEMSALSLPETKDLFEQDEIAVKAADEPASADDTAKPAPKDVIEIFEPAASGETITVSGIGPDAAFDVRDEDVEVADEPELDNIAAEPIDNQAAEDEQDRDDDQQDEHPPLEVANQPIQLRSVKTVEDKQTDPKPIMRPRSFYDERPDDVDSLQAIGGIDPGIEKLLNDHGCYQFRQLAQASAEDIEWLARQVDNIPDLRERIERDGWVEQARELQAKKYVTTNAERPRWWSRRRLR